MKIILDKSFKTAFIQGATLFFGIALLTAGFTLFNRDGMVPLSVTLGVVGLGSILFSNYVAAKANW